MARRNVSSSGRRRTSPRSLPMIRLRRMSESVILCLRQYLSQSLQEPYHHTVLVMLDLRRHVERETQGVLLAFLALFDFAIVVVAERIALQS
ncbi:hypothetical protein VTI28DRAFT_1477 [Corynascus sepedonium]